MSASTPGTVGPSRAAGLEASGDRAPPKGIRPRYRSLASAGVAVVIFAFVLPRLADYGEAWASLTAMTGYELGAVLYNPFGGDEPVLKLLPARVEQFADGLGQPVERIVAWGFVQAVLSEVWDA